MQAPAQVQISEELPLAEAEALMAASGMAPPLVVKPVWTDGREGSHGLAVVHDMASLSNLLAGEAGSGVKPPVVIQEFVEHGGVLFKVWGRVWDCRARGRTVQGMCLGGEFVYCRVCGARGRAVLKVWRGKRVEPLDVLSIIAWQVKCDLGVWGAREGGRGSRVDGYRKDGAGPVLPWM